MLPNFGARIAVHCRLAQWPRRPRRVTIMAAVPPLVTLVLRLAARMPPIEHPASDALHEDVSNENCHCGAK
jgi:hypothetical protein